MLLPHRELCGGGQYTTGSPGASCPAPAKGWGGQGSTLRLSPPGTRHPALGLVPSHTLRLHLCCSKLLTTALVRTLSVCLAGAVGRLSWPQPAQAWLGALPKQCGYTAFLCRGNSEAAFADWPFTLPSGGAEQESFCPAGEAGVTISEGQDTEAMVGCVQARESLIWGG